VPVPRNNSSTGGTLEGETMEPINCTTAAGGSCKEGL
jgi:hypothetical protein